MIFEWDEAKSLRTWRERGFGFDYAARIFMGPTIEKRVTAATTARSGRRRLVGPVTISCLSSTRIGAIRAT